MNEPAHPDADLTLRHAFEKHVDAASLSKRYRWTLTSVLNCWERCTNNPPVGAITREALTDYEKQCAAAVRPRTAKNRRNLVALILNRLDARGVIVAPRRQWRPRPAPAVSRRRRVIVARTPRRPLTARTPLREFFDYWFLPEKLRDASDDAQAGLPKSSYDAWTSALRSFEKSLGRPARAAHLNRHNVAAFPKLALRLGYSAESVRIARTRLRRLWRFAGELGLVAPPPSVARREPWIRQAEVWRPERAGGRELLGYLENVYCLERDLCERSKRQLVIGINCFSDWLGRPATLEDLERETVNKFLLDFGNSGRSKRTVKGKKTALVCIWNLAFDNEDVETEPKRLRKIRLSVKIPTAWTQDELRAILAACGELPGTIYGILRADFFTAITLTAYDTGLRRGDVLALRREQIEADGAMVLTQHKTQVEHTCRVRPATLAAIDRTFPPHRDRIFPVAEGERATKEFYDGWRKINQLAGLPRHRWGAMAQLRRTSASHVERASPGAGAGHLGHKPGSVVAQKHYLDPRITQADRPLPPDPFGGDDPPPAMRVVGDDDSQSEVA